ncbi:hypothetical protein GGR51DRAFT_539553 [Nemania sp. FL0031]|nr:hypothetical protein GGR51DRAFT_539553 [Nemania sp. FL0031]
MWFSHGWIYLALCLILTGVWISRLNPTIARLAHIDHSVQALTGNPALQLCKPTSPHPFIFAISSVKAVWW